MTKQDVAGEVARRVHRRSEGCISVSTPEAKLIIDTFTDVVMAAVAKGHGVTIRGFGAFTPQHRAEKKARLIKANKGIIIPAHTKPVFKPAAEFMELVRIGAPAEIK